MSEFGGDYFDVTQSANRFVANAKNGWSDLVTLAHSVKPHEAFGAAKTLARAAGVGRPTLQRKIQAIHAALAAGLSVDEVKAKGQEAIVGKFLANKKRERYEPIVKMTHLVSPAIKEAFEREAWRIAKVLGIRTQEHFFEYLVSQMVQWTTEELVHSAGEGDATTRHKRGT